MLYITCSIYVPNAQATRFHDDKSLYSGVHGRGGPSTKQTGAIHDIGTLLDRSDYDVRGRKLDGQGNVRYN
jgi:hypothetical protein